MIKKEEFDIMSLSRGINNVYSLYLASAALIAGKLSANNQIVIGCTDGFVYNLLCICKDFLDLGYCTDETYENYVTYHLIKKYGINI